MQSGIVLPVRWSGRSLWKLEIFDPPRQESEKLLIQFARNEYVYYEAELETREVFTTLKEIVTAIHPEALR